jgi:hypothetical protein
MICLCGWGDFQSDEEGLVCPIIPYRSKHSILATSRFGYPMYLLPMELPSMKRLGLIVFHVKRFISKFIIVGVNVYTRDLSLGMEPIEVNLYPMELTHTKWV